MSHDQHFLNRESALLSIRFGYVSFLKSGRKFLCNLVSIYKENSRRKLWSVCYGFLGVTLRVTYILENVLQFICYLSKLPFIVSYQTHLWCLAFCVCHLTYFVLILSEILNCPFHDFFNFDMKESQESVKIPVKTLAADLYKKSIVLNDWLIDCWRNYWNYKQNLVQEIRLHKEILAAEVLISTTEWRTRFLWRILRNFSSRRKDKWRALVITTPRPKRQTALTRRLLWTSALTDSLK